MKRFKKITSIVFALFFSLLLIACNKTTYTLSYEAETGGTITGELTQEVKKGSDGTLVKATPDEGYSFLEWSDGVKTPERTDKNVTKDITVKAKFEENVDEMQGIKTALTNLDDDVSNVTITGTHIFKNFDDGYELLIEIDSDKIHQRLLTLGGSPEIFEKYIDKRNNDRILYEKDEKRGNVWTSEKNNKYYEFDLFLTFLTFLKVEYFEVSNDKFIMKSDSYKDYVTPIENYFKDTDLQFSFDLTKEFLLSVTIKDNKIHIFDFTFTSKAISYPFHTVLEFKDHDKTVVEFPVTDTDILADLELAILNHEDNSSNLVVRAYATIGDESMEVIVNIDGDYLHQKVYSGESLISESYFDFSGEDIILYEKEKGVWVSGVDSEATEESIKSHLAFINLFSISYFDVYKDKCVMLDEFKEIYISQLESAYIYLDIDTNHPYEIIVTSLNGKIETVLIEYTMNDTKEGILYACSMYIEYTEHGNASVTLPIVE